MMSIRRRSRLSRVFVEHVGDVQVILEKGIDATAVLDRSAWVSGESYTEKTCAIVRRPRDG